MMPASFEELLREAQADPDVVGVVLGGSRGKGALLTERSDHDVYVIVRDEARLAPHRRGEPVEVVTMTLAEFREHALPGSPTAWNAYTFAHVTPLVDKLGGEIAELMAAKSRVDPASAAGPLDAYVNCYYRSAKNARDGHPLEAQLDAAESVPYFLEFLFRVFGRVRPYNKWLRWELENHSLESPWRADELLPRLERILAGDEAEQQALFRDVERLARSRGLGEVIDGWEPDVPFLRGDPSIEG
ncbi:MAG: hypothetical protein WD981_03725 [Gaiellaceae bacterium]